MRLYRLDSMAACAAAFDCETHLGQPGLTAPPIVCGSLAALVGQLQGELLTVEAALEAFRSIISNPNAVLVGANIPYDLLVCAVEFSRRGVDVMPQIFAAFEQHRIYDVQIAEALSAIAEGCHEKDPRTGAPLVNPETGKKGRYSLAAVVDLQLGRKDAKSNDRWRKRYYELAGIPMDQWPFEARQYPVDDAVNTLECALAQTGHVPSTHVHRWSSGGPGTEVRCTRCGQTPDQAQGQPLCVARSRVRNLHDLAAQVESHWAMHLGAAHGFHVDQRLVDVIENDRLASKDGADVPFIEAGILRADGSQDLSATKRRVALAYGAKDPCPTCRGTGKITSPRAKLVKCYECRGKSADPASGFGFCGQCGNSGKVPTRSASGQVNCADFGDVAIGSVAVGAKVDKSKTCDGTGLALIDDVPRSEKEGIGYGRDVLTESGDELLIAFAEWDEDKKDLTVYVPFLRGGRLVSVHVGCGCASSPGSRCTTCGACRGPKLAGGRCRQCGIAPPPEQVAYWPHATKRSKPEDRTAIDVPAEACEPGVISFLPPGYVDIPLTLRPNVIKETGRTSYDGVVQLLKREPGHIREDDTYIPSLRECIVARSPQYVVVQVPDNYQLKRGEERL